jgi:TetR/AcrR family transcriptional regulator, transcriptional repressor for nem operon
MPRPKSFDEAAVLDQAMYLFWERGYEGTSLTDLETRLGLGRQSLYNAFGDKQALFHKALDRYRQVRADVSLADLNAPDSGLDTIRAFFHSMIECGTAPGERKGCLFVKTITERGPEDPSAMMRCTSAGDALERAFRRALTHARDRGEVSSDLDIEAAATLLVIQNYGLGVMAQTGAPATELHAAAEALLKGLK